LISFLGYSNEPCGIFHDSCRRRPIIHPICRSDVIGEYTIYKLSDIIQRIMELLNKNGITLYLENNSKLDPIFSTAKEIEIVFSNNPALEFVLDIAHIYSYGHLKELIPIKTPKILHIAYKHFDVIHEHLPIGYGEINFEYKFEKVLCNYNGKIILEIAKENADIVKSRNIISSLLTQTACSTIPFSPI